MSIGSENLRIFQAADGHIILGPPIPITQVTMY